MAQDGSKTKIKLGAKPEVAAAGTASASVTLKNPILLAEMVGMAVTIGGTTTTISAVTSTTQCTLATTATWAAGATLDFDPVTVTGQRTLSIGQGGTMVDVTDKDLEDVQKMIQGVKDHDITFSHTYQEGDETQLAYLIAAFYGVKFRFEITSTADTTEARAGDCFVTGINGNVPMEDVFGCEVTLKVSGGIS